LRAKTTFEALGRDAVAAYCQKKSTQGIKTPEREFDLVRDWLKRLKAIT
jgi:hypothetical protein